MAFQFNGFRATKPVVSLIDASKCIYEVFFIVYDPDGKRHRKRYKKGLNEVSDGDRPARAKGLATVLWEGLQAGWNPMLQKYPDFTKKGETTRELLFDAALDYAFKAKEPHLSKYSRYDYSGAVRFMKKAAKAADLLHRNVSTLERKDIRLLIATAKEQNSWSSNARNKYLSLLQSLLSVLVDEELIKFNPAHKIKQDPTLKGMGYKRLTDEQKQDIANRLASTVPDFFEFLMFIYQLGIRRSELLQVRVGDLHLGQRYINIRAEVAKMNRGRRVPITDDLLAILQRREILKLDSSWFLFSNSKFMPGPHPYHPNVPTEWWRKLVIDAMGIDCKMYSLKHKGADDKIIAGLDIDVLRTLYGHRSSQMTEIYAKEVKNKYAQQIIDQAPEFAKVIKLKKAK